MIESGGVKLGRRPKRRVDEYCWNVIRSLNWKPVLPMDKIEGENVNKSFLAIVDTV